MKSREDAADAEKPSAIFNEAIVNSIQPPCASLVSEVSSASSW